MCLHLDKLSLLKKIMRVWDCKMVPFFQTEYPLVPRVLDMLVIFNRMSYDNLYFPKAKSIGLLP